MKKEIQEYELHNHTVSDVIEFLSKFPQDAIFTVELSYDNCFYEGDHPNLEIKIEWDDDD